MSGKISIGSKLILPVMILLSFISVLLLKMGAIFVLLALLPSVVAYYMDRDPHLSTLKTVVACNLAAILPVLYPMLKAGFMFEPYNTYAVIVDPLNWIIAYVGAAMGWALIFLCRFIARFVVTVAYEVQIHELERAQKHLIKEWGNDLELTPVSRLP